MATVGLVLGGGGSRGAYEIGVWQALRELGIRIDVVTGTSVGAINGAMICQGSFELAVKIWKELETHMVFDLEEEVKTSAKFDFNFDIAGMSLDKINSYAKEIFTNGGADVSGLKKLLNEHLNENTLRESAIDYGLVAVEYPSLTPFYMKKQDIPRGQMADYILASAACFPAIKTYEIGEKKFIDGGYSDNLPINFAVSMGADSIIAVDLDTLGMTKKTDKSNIHQMAIISSSWDLGNFLIFDKVNSSRIMRLGYLDTMKTFGVFDGNYYTFKKGEFGKRDLSDADSAAKVFQLNPESIYIRQVLERQIVDEIQKYQLESPKGLPKTGEWIELLLAKIKQGIRKVQRDLDSRSIALELAKDIKSDENSKSLFLVKNSKKILADEIAAAEYIVKAGLI